MNLWTFISMIIAVRSTIKIVETMIISSVLKVLKVEVKLTDETSVLIKILTNYF